MPKILTLVLVTIICLLQSPCFAESLWIESESLPQKPSLAKDSWVKPEWQSGGKVLAVDCSSGEVTSVIPETGLVLSYPIEISSSGKFNLWNRVVFSNIRSSFEWRIDEGTWVQNSEEQQPITNIQELAFWNPIGWTSLGAVEIAKGSHQLQIRLSRQAKNPNDPKQGFQDLHYISDAIFLTTEEFQPNFYHQPGKDSQSEQDRLAANQQFSFNSSNDPRQALALTGLWEFAPYDEIGSISEESRVSGVEAYPKISKLSWCGISLPNNRDEVLPEARFSHRFILRTKVKAPENFTGYQLDFQCLNLIQTLFINGHKVGDFDIAKSRWLVDVSPFINPGKVNEILLVVKDTYYAIAVDKDGHGIRHAQYFPESLFNTNQGVTMRMDFPVVGHSQAGIIDTVSLMATKRPVYVEGIFVQPYPITKKEILFDVSIKNVEPQTAKVTIRQSIESWPEKAHLIKVGEQEISLPAKSSQKIQLKTSSKPLTLWWIYEATLYNLKTEVLMDGKVVDTQMTRFGNREWEIRGNQFFLNGVQQHLRSDLTNYWIKYPMDPKKILNEWKNIGNNMFRRRFQFSWNGLSIKGTLGWMDEVGMPVRMTAGTFDGQICSYGLVETIEGQRGPRKKLFERWRAQMLNGVETHKNHPSVFIWELDNEVVYINGRNFGLLNEVEPEFTKTSHEILALDPTRSTISGGGRALRDESLPTYGVHYFEVEDRYYPDEAYSADRALALEGTGRDARVWPMDFNKKPTFFSETAFLPGRNPSGYASFGGESTFLGKRESKEALGLYASWIAEGYRWKGFAANQMYFDKAFTDGSFTYAWQPVAILRRQWNDTFTPREKVKREFRVYNDLHDTRPIIATWVLNIEGKEVMTSSREFTVAPGTYETWNTEFILPSQASTRKTGQLCLSASRAGEIVFSHELPVTLLPEPKSKAIDIKGPLVVWDTMGETLSYLKKLGYKDLVIANSLASIPEQFGLLIVGRNTLSEKDSTHRRWQALTIKGNKILILEQKYPLHYQATPADIETTDYDGRMAFSQNIQHPIFAGLEQDDLAFWGEDHVVYRHAMKKPSHGATSLVHCDDALGYSALLETPIEQGLILQSQLAIGEKLNSEVVARILFSNMLQYAAKYKKIMRPMVTSVDNAEVIQALGSIGLKNDKTADLIDAIKNNTGGIVLVEGVPNKLKALAENPKVLETFWKSGGYLVILNINPDSLESFNKIVGYEHILRPFREELVRFPALTHSLTAGLTLRDVVMSSGRRIQNFNADEWPNSDAFDTIVDLEDIAPFVTFPSPAYWNDPKTTGPGDDTWPQNMVNGFTADTHWRMVFSIHLGNGDPTHWTMTLPRAETITQIRVRPNRLYHQISEYRVTLDGDTSSTETISVDSSDELQVINLKNPRSAKTIDLNLSKWVECGRADVVGIDNMEILVKRPDDFKSKVRPMLNIGGLVEYPRHQGGVLLSQYVFRANESNPVNAEKKKNLLSTLLKNLGADLGGAKTAVAGYNLQYTPISLENYGNLYLSKAQGWSAQGGDLSALPLGKNTFSGVQYNIRDFKTSPLESGVTLKHPLLKSNASAEQIQGIAVNDCVDSLFFLHTFLETKVWQSNWQSSTPPALFQYIIHYEGGLALPVVVTLNESVSPWLQAKEAPSLPKAEIAWRGPSADTAKQNNLCPTVYQFQWNNPKPSVKILSIDFSYAENGKDFGAPVLLGVTSAKVID